MDYFCNTYGYWDDATDSIRPDAQKSRRVDTGVLVFLNWYLDLVLLPLGELPRQIAAKWIVHRDYALSAGYARLIT